MDVIYCINKRCPYKSKCHRGKLMDKQWFMEHIHELKPQQVKFFNSTQHIQCEDIIPLDHHL